MKKNISIFDKCANCGACSNICPVNAIWINKDDIFYQPVVDESKCINCGKCVDGCPVNNDINYNNPIMAYAGWSTNITTVLESSSGGVFHELAMYVHENAGIVYAAVYSDDYKTVVFKSSDVCGIKEMQKSKYVESEVENAFKDIKKNLEKGRTVLFCGTPCQNAGLKSFLKREYENLITCDFSCGGLPSHMLYRECIERLEEAYKSSAVSVDFRPKSHGWKRYALSIKFQNGKKYNRLAEEDNYFRAFFKKLSVRDYCLECKFAKQHMSDITLADFWLHEKYSDINNKDGISLVLCNTKKGIELFDKVKPMVYCKSLDIVKASYNIKDASIDETSRCKHNSFIEDLKNNGFDMVRRKYLKVSALDNFKGFAKRALYKVR